MSKPALLHIKISDKSIATTLACMGMISKLGLSEPKACRHLLKKPIGKNTAALKPQQNILITTWKNFYRLLYSQFQVKPDQPSFDIFILIRPVDKLSSADKEGDLVSKGKLLEFFDNLETPSIYTWWMKEENE